MDHVTLFFVVMAYAATAVFLAGFAMKIVVYLTTPSPLKIAATPAPTTSGGAVLRVMEEVFLFKSLFRGNKWTWLAGYGMHAFLTIVLIRHGLVLIGVSRGENDLSFAGLGPLLGPPVQLFWDFTFRVGLLFPLTILFVLVRRFWVARTRYISTFADYAVVALLLGIALSGVTMKYIVHEDVEAIHRFLFGLALLKFVPVPDAPVFLIHFTLVMTLLVMIPFSKLLHIGGVFLNPTRTQADSPRDRRVSAPVS